MNKKGQFVGQLYRSISGKYRQGIIFGTVALFCNSPGKLVGQGVKQKSDGKVLEDLHMGLRQVTAIQQGIYH